MMGPVPRPAIERFLPKIGEVDANGCWPWLATTMRGGHGQFYDGRKRMLAHRFAYELFVGEIPDGMQLHHVCKKPACVNPAHLAPITPQEHTRLHQTRPMGETCKNGHPWEPNNLYVSTHRPTGRPLRQCKICTKAAAKAAYRRRVGIAA